MKREDLEDSDTDQGLGVGLGKGRASFAEFYCYLPLAPWDTSGAE